MSATTQNFIIGNKTRLFFTILPGSLLNTPAAPSDVIMTTSAAVSQGATSIPVTATSGPVPVGTPITFSKAGSPDVKVYTTADSVAAAVTIPVEATSQTIPSGAQGTYTALLPLVGGTTSSEQIQSQDTETYPYGTGSGVGVGFGTGIITKATWQVGYTFNVLPSDDGYFRLAYAGRYAINGVYGWLVKQDPVPAGYTNGESIQGLVQVADFQKQNPSDQIITGTLTFKGRGTPIISHYS